MKRDVTDAILVILAFLFALLVLLLYSLARGGHGDVLRARLFGRPDEDAQLLAFLSARHRAALQHAVKAHAAEAAASHRHRINSSGSSSFHLSPDEIRRIAAAPDSALYHSPLIFSPAAVLPTARVASLRSIGPGAKSAAAYLAPASLNAMSPLARSLTKLHLGSFSTARTIVPSIVVNVAHANSQCGDGGGGASVAALRLLLESIDVEFRFLVLVVVAPTDDDEQRAELERFCDDLVRSLPPSAITVLTMHQRLTWTEGLNLGLRRARELLSGQSEFSFVSRFTESRPFHVLISSCAVAQAPEAMRALALSVLSHSKFHGSEQPGLFFSFSPTSSYFALLDAAISTVGFFDENFANAELALVDFAWRARVAANMTLTQTPTVLLRAEDGGSDSGDGDDRAAIDADCEMLFMLHGVPASLLLPSPTLQWMIASQNPHLFPRTHPFGVASLPAHLWAVDPVRRRCIVSGKNTSFPRVLDSDTCWFNFSAAGLAHSMLPSERIPNFLLQPTVSLRRYSGDDYEAEETFAADSLPPAAFVVLVVLIIAISVMLTRLLWQEDEKKVK